MPLVYCNTTLSPLQGESAHGRHLPGAGRSRSSEKDTNFIHTLSGRQVVERLGTTLSEVEGELPVYRADEQGMVEIVTDGAQAWG